jgi:hypothetical protein
VKDELPVKMAYFQGQTVNLPENPTMNHLWALVDDRHPQEMVDIPIEQPVETQVHVPLVPWFRGSRALLETIPSSLYAMGVAIASLFLNPVHHS